MVSSNQVREARIAELRKEAKKMDWELPRRQFIRELQRWTRMKYHIGLTAARDYSNLAYDLELREREREKRAK